MYQNIFDTHSHYTDAAFDADREQVLASLPEKGVSHAMLAACNLEDSSACIQLAQQHADLLYASVGIHPEAEGTQPADYLQQLAELAAADCVKAIGEIGMDYHYEGYRKEAQMRLFQEQVDLAKQLHLPVIVHIRDATEDAMRVLKDQRPAGVVALIRMAHRLGYELVVRECIEPSGEDLNAGIESDEEKRKRFIDDKVKEILGGK